MLTKIIYNLGNNGKIINPQENLLKAINIYIFVLGADEHKVYLQKHSRACIKSFIDQNNR